MKTKMPIQMDYYKFMLKRYGTHLYIGDIYTGAKLSPNAISFFEREFTNYHVYTNDMGFRVNTSHQKQKLPVDIVILGCSIAMGAGVDYEESFAYKLQRKLKDYKIANLSVSGYSTLQMIRKLKQHLNALKPKLVILCHSLVNTRRCFKYNAFDGVLLRPVFVLRKQQLIVKHIKYILPNDMLQKVSRYKQFPTALNRIRVSFIQAYVRYKNNMLFPTTWEFIEKSDSDMGEKVKSKLIADLNCLASASGFKVLVHEIFLFKENAAYRIFDDHSHPNSAGHDVILKDLLCQIVSGNFLD